MEAVNNDFWITFGVRSVTTAMWVARDPTTGHARLVCAGHPPPLATRNGGRTEAILSSGSPVGLLEQSEFLETNIDVEPGEAFFLYPDGLYSSGNDENPRLSSGRLGAILQPMTANAQRLLTRVMKQAAMSDEGTSASDDVAVLVVRRSS